jgi:hypothetical protein
VITDPVTKNAHSKPTYENIVPGNTGITTPRSPITLNTRAVIINAISIFIYNSN